MKKMTKIAVLIFTAALIVIYVVAVLIHNGIIWPNTPSEEEFPVRGVDVSAYQGKIDWDVLKSQNIDFAFIKATEGSSFKDKMFSENFKNAYESGIRIGAYHFFSYDSSGITQAENYIDTVPVKENMLPPVLDVEFYGDKSENLPDAETTRENLLLMIDMLKEHYGMQPVIYATRRSYDLYISGYFKDSDIWIRSVSSEASLPDGRDWKFWQYCHKGRLDGYDGDEKFIDLDVFNGTAQEFAEYVG